MNGLEVSQFYDRQEEFSRQLAEKAGKSEIATLQNEMSFKASKQDIQQISLAYKESYSTLAALQAAYPNGSNTNHAVLADNMIYTYKNGWVSTGIQANGTGIPASSVTAEKLSSDIKRKLESLKVQSTIIETTVSINDFTTYSNPL